MSLKSPTIWTGGKRTTLVLALFLLIVGTSSAYGVTTTIQLVLSTHVSDGNTGPSAEELDATLDFTVVDNTLTLVVTNLTPDADILGAIALKIDEIYFNAADNITGLTLTDVEGTNTGRWLSEFVQGGDGASHQVNGFGRFDMYLKDEPGKPATYIDSGAWETFTFEIAWEGTAPSASDFIDLSTQVDGHIISYAAAKFYDGPDVSAFGATNVPEPATVLLLGLGGLALLRKRRT